MRRWLALVIPVVLGAATLLNTAAVAAATATAVARCDGVRLREGPSTSYVTRLVIGKGTSVTVAAEVKGSGYDTQCGGQRYAGKTWAKVSAVDGQTLQSKLGVDYLYVAAGLLRTVSVSATPTVTPPRATLAPTATPTATAPPPPTSSPTSAPSPTDSATTAPVPSARATVAPAAGPTAGPSDPLSGFGTVLVILVVGLATLSLVLTVALFRERKRQEHRRAMSEVPATRLEDILS
jgi:uncharacterized protein YraI